MKLTDRSFIYAELPHFIISYVELAELYVLCLIPQGMWEPSL